MNRHHTLISLFSSAALLTACGGGSDDTPPPAPPPAAATDAVSPEASVSAAGLKNYLTELGTLLVEDKEPVDLSSFTPPAADDTEPETLG